MHGNAQRFPKNPGSENKARGWFDKRRPAGSSISGRGIGRVRNGSAGEGRHLPQRPCDNLDVFGEKIDAVVKIIHVQCQPLMKWKWISGSKKPYDENRLHHMVFVVNIGIKILRKPVGRSSMAYQRSFEGEASWRRPADRTASPIRAHSRPNGK